MERWGRLLWRLGSGIWLGSMFFLFVAIAPNVFRVLGDNLGGRLVDAMFPTYYAIGLGSGGMLLLGAVLSMGTHRGWSRWALVAVGVVNFLLIWWAVRILAVMHRISPSGALFHSLHQRSVAISTVSFVIILFGIVWESLTTA